MCADGMGAGVEARGEETNRKERSRKNGERRNGGGIRTREERGCSARITRTTGSAGCIFTDSRRYVRARARTPAEPICPLPSTVAHLLE